MPLRSATTTSKLTNSIASSLPTKWLSDSHRTILHRSPRRLGRMNATSLPLHPIGLHRRKSREHLTRFAAPCASKPNSTRSSKTSTTYEGGNDFRPQDNVAQPPRSRISGQDLQPESFLAPGAGQRAQKRSRPLRQFADYASKETLGQVHAGGFLHHLILINEDGSRTAPSQLTNDERKRRISERGSSTSGNIRPPPQNPVVQHRLVFSMSREMHDKLVEARINPDRVLQSTTKKVMGKFNERFHPADSIGYAYGIHHDTDNLHVHVAFCPAHGKRRVCRMQHHPDSIIGTQGPDGISALVFRAGKISAGKRFSPHRKNWRSAFPADRLRQGRLFSAPESFPDGGVAKRANGRGNPPSTALFQRVRNLEASITAKRKSFALKKSANLVSRLVGRRPPKGGARRPQTRRRRRPSFAAGNATSSFQDQGGIPRRP